MDAPAILYKYYSSDRGRAVLENQHVYFSHSYCFNDPFDLNPHIKEVLVDEDFSRGPQDIQAVENLKRHFNTPEYAQQAKRNWQEEFVVFSVSEPSDSLLMWAYYADSHRGLVIGFDTSGQSFACRKDGTSRFLERVRYSTHRPSARALRDLRPSEILFTKSVEWIHEREWRMFESPTTTDGPQPSDGRFPFAIETDVVREVIVGARASVADIDRVTALLAQDCYRHVDLFRSVVDEQQFRLNIVRM